MMFMISSLEKSPESTSHTVDGTGLPEVQMFTTLLEFIEISMYLGASNPHMEGAIMGFVNKHARHSMMHVDAHLSSGNKAGNSNHSTTSSCGEHGLTGLQVG